MSNNSNKRFFYIVDVNTSINIFRYRRYEAKLAFFKLVYLTGEINKKRLITYNRRTIRIMLESHYI